MKPFTQRNLSFVKREGRLTSAQATALEKYWPIYGLTLNHSNDNPLTQWDHDTPCVLEIRFGNGETLYQQAMTHPDIHFIGIEVYRPGIGTLLAKLAKQPIPTTMDFSATLGTQCAANVGLSTLHGASSPPPCRQPKQDNRYRENIHLFNQDAFDVLTQAMPDRRLDCVQIFFPDPWPKRRHHKRRLIQPVFIQLLQQKLKPNGLLHIATDWQHYADHIKQVMAGHPAFVPYQPHHTTTLPPLRRPLTKFEQRGKRLGHLIHDLRYTLYLL